MDTSNLPTKNNLLRIKEKLKLSKQGHSLLEKKKFILTIEENKYKNEKEKLEKQLQILYDEAYNKIQNAVIDVGIDELITIAEEIEIDNSINIKYKTIMGIEIPSIVFDKERLQLKFGLYNTSTSIDETMMIFVKIKELLIKITEIENTIIRIKQSIEKVQKRSNALRDIIIPENEKLKKQIENILEEREREEFTRMKIIKKKM